MRKLLLLLAIAATAIAQNARTIHYHSQDILSVKAKLRFTTLIQLPASEKIIDAATGDKEFWIVDVVNNFCFVHPAKVGITSNLNLITDHGNVYTFTLTEITGQGDPDLKLIIEPADQSSLSSSSGPPKFVPADQLADAQKQLSAIQSSAVAQVANAIDEYKDKYTSTLKFDYHYKPEPPFAIESIYHDDRFTYIKTGASEKFSVYEEKDGKPDMINYTLKDGTYVIPKIVDKGYLEVGKKKMTFERKG